MQDNDKLENHTFCDFYGWIYELLKRINLSNTLQIAEIHMFGECDWLTP